MPKHCSGREAFFYYYYLLDTKHFCIYLSSYLLSFTYIKSTPVRKPPCPRPARTSVCPSYGRRLSQWWFRTSAEALRAWAPLFLILTASACSSDTREGETSVNSFLYNRIGKGLAHARHKNSLIIYTFVWLINHRKGPKNHTLRNNLLKVDDRETVKKPRTISFYICNTSNQLNRKHATQFNSQLFIVINTGKNLIPLSS